MFDYDFAMSEINKIFSVGATWPPVSHRERLKSYAVNEALYEGNHTAVFHRLKKVFTDNEAEHQKLVLTYNFPRRLSTLWADLTFGEHPIVKIDDDKKKATWHQFGEINNQFWSVCYQAVIDLSRYGDCVFRIWTDDVYGAGIEATNPAHWFPISNPFTGEDLAQCIAYTTEYENVNYLRAEIHTPGWIENRMYIVKDGKLLSEVNVDDFSMEASVETNIPYPLVFPVSGQDDYKSIASIIESLEMRYTRIGRILDYHSEPDKGVPDTAFELDQNGLVRYNQNKKIWPITEGGSLPQYITWAEGGVMAANFAHIEALMQRLYEVSETCKAAFDLTSTGRALSGTALRLMLSIPLKKAARMMGLLSPLIPKLVLIATTLQANNFEDSAVIDDFSFSSSDGLPKDFVEQANTFVALKGANLVSTERVLHELFQLTGADLETELKRILQEETVSKTTATTPAPLASAAKAAEDLASYTQR